MTAAQTPSAATPAFGFDNSYARLPERFYARLNPTPVAEPRLVRVNHALAEELGLDPAALESAEGVAILAGNRIAAGSEPLAQAYAGHQFGGWSPQLGDGRAILLGEVVDRQGRRRDIQLKGSGRTPFSRMGDGRAPLGPVLREYIVSEAMHALGVPTTRSLAAVATGEAVLRETALPGGVLTRVASSHMRVGTFQFFAAREDAEGLRALADYAIARHDPAAAEAEDPYLALLEGVAARQAALVAQWLSLGFIHGVMNTDNMTISGETIDYGPCAFMEGFQPDMVFSSIDQFGRYAYGAQPTIAQWNLAALAQALLPLIAGDEDASIDAAKGVIERYPGVFKEAWLSAMRAKLGLATAEAEDQALVDAFLSGLAEREADFTQSFRALNDAAETGSNPWDAPWSEAWAARWRARLGAETRSAEVRRAEMDRANPLYIPRNHLVEEAIAAGYSGDFEPFETLLSVLAQPFVEQSGRSRYAAPAKAEEQVTRTFCGT